MLTKIAISMLFAAGLFTWNAGTGADNSAPTCCIKQAYCCQEHRACCANGLNDHMAVSIAQPQSRSGERDCCVANAACCLNLESCCNGAANGVNLSADHSEAARLASTCCTEGEPCCPHGSCCSAGMTSSL